MKDKKKEVDEGTFKSFDGLDLSKIPGSATEILTTNWEKFNTCKTYEDVVALCHELLDGKLDTKWSNMFFYRLDQIGKENLNPQRAFTKAMLYVNNARMKGAGLGMDRGTRAGGRRFYEGEEIDESMDDNQKKDFQKKLHDGEVKFKYTKKDGSERTARGTLKPELMDLPKKLEDKTDSDVDKASAAQTKKRKLPIDSVFYYDLDSKGFRSFKMANFIDYL